MIPRWLAALGLMLALTACLRAQTVRAHLAAPVAPAGSLAVPIDTAHGRLQPYVPEPGDIVLYDDNNKLFHFAFKLANTAPPTHTAIVIARADGSSALLDLTGPRVISATVHVLDVEPRLASYQGTIMVRRLRQPLTADQSRELTQFAEAQLGKAFAWHRVLLQGTPFCRLHRLLRHALFGHTYLNRDRWFCSELVIAAGAAAHLIDPKAYCANAIYPRDLAVDQVVDLSGLYEPPQLWVAQGSEGRTVSLTSFKK